MNRSRFSAFADIPRVIAAAFAVGLSGCGNDGSTAGAVGAGTEAARATYEEAEHHVPAHKPSGFPDAVDSLRRRTEDLRAGLSKGRGAEPTAAAEWRDIAGWLPALGADSDLTEEEWQPIAVASTELERLLDDAVASSGAGRDEAFARIGRTLDSLAAIAAARPGAFEVVPHEHHEHHDHGHD